MSRGYQVAWTTVSSTVNETDCLELGVGLMGILPEDQMKAILREEMAKDGWTTQPDGSMTKTLDGIPMVLSPDACSVKVSRTAEAKVNARGQNERQADEELDRAEENAKKALGEKLAKELTALEPKLQAEMNEAVQRVYKEALTRKARSYGTVESVQEGADGEITIKVRA